MPGRHPEQRTYLGEIYVLLEPPHKALSTQLWTLAQVLYCTVLKTLPLATASPIWASQVSGITLDGDGDGDGTGGEIVLSNLVVKMGLGGGRGEGQGNNACKVSGARM